MAGKYRCYKLCIEPTVNVQAKIEESIVDVVRQHANSEQRSLAHYSRKWFLEGFHRDFKAKKK